MHLCLFTLALTLDFYIFSSHLIFMVCYGYLKIIIMTTAVPSLIRPTHQQTKSGLIRQVASGEGEPSMNAHFMANWPFIYKYTCALLTCETSNTAAVPPKWCFAENDNDECVWQPYLTG